MKISQDNSLLIIGQHLTSRTEAVRDYFIPRLDQVCVIALGAAFVDKKENHFFYYQHGNLREHLIFRHGLLRKSKLYEILIPATFLFYLCDIFRSLAILKRRFDVFIGISHFSGLLGILLKTFGICRRNIYYSIDYYAPSKDANRFRKVLLKIENFFDKFAVLYSDEVWDISPRISEARLEFSGIKKESYRYKNKIAPLGYSRKFFTNKNTKDIERYSVVFIGVIVEGQGLELILEVLPEIKKIIPAIKIKIIGTGPFLEKFKGLVFKKKMQDRFIFYGFIESNEEMLDIVSSSAVGISLWDNRDNKLLNSYFGDPGKTKLYSVCGLPAIVSNDTVYSQVITRNKAGIAIDYAPEALAAALRTLLREDSVYYEYKSNAINTAEDYCNSEKIFSEVLNQ